VILQVRQWNLNSKEGAKLLGVSRKTYYEWEEKSLKGRPGFGESSTGKPPASIDPEKETLSGADSRVGEGAAR